MMKNKKIKILSKSKLMRGAQCPKNLWLNLNRPDLEAEVDDTTQMQFDEGNEIGELARKHFGKGVLIEGEYWDFVEAAKKTTEAIKNGETTLFEAAFLTDDYYARADILHKGKKGWELIEVKKSTSVKDYHYQDAGIQALIIEQSGLKLNSVIIMHINNKCIYPNLKNLFSIEDITEEVRANEKSLKKIISNLKKVASSKEEPEIEIGSHCDDPFECPFKGHCWGKVPNHSIFELPGLNANKAWELYSKGKVRIKDLDLSSYKGKTKRAIESVVSNEMFIDKKGISSALKEWKWPLYFFDFETLGPALPRYNNTSPYQAVPFQFSCHVWNSPKDIKLDHFEYLHTDVSDPRPGIILNMLQGIKKKGSIVAYNMTFEKGKISKLIEFDPKNKVALEDILGRFVDPLPIIRENVYHPEFKGSFSIKTVGPALLGTKFSYEGMDIGDGGTAQIFADQMLRGKLNKETKEKVIRDLLVYCQKDTLVMVELVRWLLKQI